MTVNERREEIRNLTERMKEFIEKRDLENAEKIEKELKESKRFLQFEIEQEEEEKRGLIKQGKGKKRVVDLKGQELRSLVKIMLGKEVTQEERSLVTLEGNGGLVPEQFINQLEVYRQGYPSLKKYAHVLPVTSKTGKMPVATIGQNKLAKLTSDEAIPEGAMVTDKVLYDVQDYGKFIPVEKDLTEDAAVNLISNVLMPDFAEAAIASENDEIIKIIKDSAGKVINGTSYEDINKAMDKMVPAAKAGLITVTNTEGYSYLKNQKDKVGRNLNLIETINGVEYYNKKPIVVLDDETVTATGKGNLVFHVANIREVVKFFDRKQVLIEKSTEYLFNKNQDCFRAIERFDVKKGNNRSVKTIEIKPASEA